MPLRSIIHIPGGNQLFPAEKLVILSISFFSGLILADYFIHNNRTVFLVPVSLVVILIFFWLPEARRRFAEKPLLFFIFSAFPLLGYAYLYKLAGALITFLGRDWQDEKLAWIDRLIFGTSPNLAIINFHRVWLTELMMFAYLAYIPLVVWLARVVFRRCGQEELQRYLLTLGLAYLCCFFLFLIFPAASPRFYFAHLNPAAGLILRRLMSLVEVSAQYRGGSFPSAHCAAGTVMLFFAWKSGGRTFALIAPMILLFFVSTIYGQYHYAVDVLAGIFIGLAAILASKLIPFGKKSES